MKKENIILVHSFPTNSKILKGFTKFLNGFSNVYFIDMPGFVREKSPIKKITMENFSKHLEKEIKKLNLKRYFLAGISFGFLVVNNANFDKKCKGILAIEPYINSKELKINILKKSFLFIFLTLINTFYLTNLIWRSKIFYDLLEKTYPKKYLDITIEEINSRTFFKVAKILLMKKEFPNLKNIPYFLLLNLEDKTINSKEVVDFFKKNTEKVNIICENINHYPEDMSYEYFKKSINEKEIKNLIEKMNKTI
jgi:hypothetical protein